MKTIDEAAKQFEFVVNGKLTTAFKKGVEFGQRWIPVEEELPEYNVDVLMKSGSFVFVGFIFDGFFILKEVVDGCHKIINGVTHWRPIELK